jgi:hypothetical protein
VYDGINVEFAAAFASLGAGYMGSAKGKYISLSFTNIVQYG